MKSSAWRSFSTSAPRCHSATSKTSFACAAWTSAAGRNGSNSCRGACIHDAVSELTQVGLQSRFYRSGFELDIVCNNSNGLAGGEGWIRVAFPPPLALAKAFSRSGCGRIFSLFSRVMREGLSTGPCARGGCGNLNSRDKWIFRVTAA